MSRRAISSLVAMETTRPQLQLGVQYIIYLLPHPPSPTPKRLGRMGNNRLKYTIPSLPSVACTEGEEVTGVGSMAQRNGEPIWEEGGTVGRREELSSLRRTEAGIWRGFRGWGSGLARGAGWGPLLSDPQPWRTEPSSGTSSEKGLQAQSLSCGRPALL